MILRRAVAGLAAMFLCAQVGCATGKWAKEDPWAEYPPPGGWEGQGRYASGYWWMPSKVGMAEYGNRGVIFYAGEAMPPPVVEKPKPPEMKVVERIVYRPIPVKKEVRADRYIFPTITFDEGSAAIASSAVQLDEKNAEIIVAPIQIQRAAELIKNSGSSIVLIEGNMDAKEKTQYPGIGQKRADAVKRALVEQGVNAGVLRTQDNEASKPLASSDTEVGRKLNRRVTFTIVPRGQSLEPETLVQPPAPAPGPNIKIVERVVEKEVTVPELVVTDHVIFPDINFEYDKSTLTPQGLENTKKAAEIVKSIERIKKLTVEGHCDSRGSDKYNDALSVRRSNSVKDKLVELGVSASMLEAKGYGEQRPIASNETPLGMALNRRVEFTIQYR